MANFAKSGHTAGDVRVGGCFFSSEVINASRLICIIPIIPFFCPFFFFLSNPIQLNPIDVISK